MFQPFSKACGRVRGFFRFRLTIIQTDGRDTRTGEQTDRGRQTVSKTHATETHGQAGRPAEADGLTARRPQRETET